MDRQINHVVVVCLHGQHIKLHGHHLWNPLPFFHQVRYSGIQNRCNVWPFSTGLNVALNKVGIVLRVG